MFFIHFKSLKHHCGNCGEFLDAAAGGDIKRVRNFLHKGMHPDIQDSGGWTALHMAAVMNRFEIAVELLKYGANANACTHTGQTALVLACECGHQEMLSLLLLYGADPDIADYRGKTPLMIAVEGGNIRITGALLNEQPQIELNKTDCKGRTALDMAKINGWTAIAEMLKAAGATGKPIMECDK